MISLCVKPTLGKLLIQRNKLSLLWIAVLSCYQETAELLVRFGADLSELYGLDSSCQLTKKSTLVHGLLQMYPSSWNERFIHLVMEHGVDLNARDSLAKTVLHVAARSGRVKSVEMLLEKRADVNAISCHRMTPLLEAASTEVDELLSLLIKYGANITAKDQYSCNVLYHLALSYYRKNVELARVLIEKGISPREEAPGQNQPIHEAIAMENIQLVKLLDHGANVNARGFDDDSPLCIATECEDPEMLLTLLNRGADIDLKERSYGGTALHRLLCTGDQTTIKKLKILLSVGADMFTEAMNGLSFFDVICDLNDIECAITRLMLRTLDKVRWKQPIDLLPEGMIEERYPELRKHYNDCIREINRLKDTRFIGSCSFADLLTKCQCQIAPLIRNHEFDSRFRMYDFRVFSPIYGEDLLESFEGAKHFYCSMLEQEYIIDEAFDYTLPYLIVRKMAKYTQSCEICKLKRIVHESRSFTINGR